MGLCQSYGLIPNVFNIFINDVIGYVDAQETHSSKIGNREYRDCCWQIIWWLHPFQEN
jgi:hypothetical protein